MAVSKELLARYKEMKAKGIQISLAELKAQMETEGGVNVATNNTTSYNDGNNSWVNATDNTTSYNDGNNSWVNATDNTTSYNDGNNSWVNTADNTTSYNDSNTKSGNAAYGYGAESSVSYQTTHTEANPVVNIWETGTSDTTHTQQNSITPCVAPVEHTSNETAYQMPETDERTNRTNSTEQSSWTTTYSSQDENIPHQQSCSTNTLNSYNNYSTNYSNSFDVNFSQNLQSAPSPENYSNTTNQMGTTTTLTPAPMPYDNHIKPIQTQTQSVQQNNCTSEDTINSPTRKFALIGYPLGHSLSSHIHNAGFKSLGLKASYEILETPPEKLVDRIKYLKTNNYCGFNVTIPLKLPVTMFLNEVDASADIVDAVNTVTIDPVTKELKGYNTDVTGFKNAIPEDFTLCGKTAGILGTGGAARAAITALAQSQMKEIKLFTRNVPNSFELVNYLRKTFPNVEFNTYQIERIRDLSDINLLVNTTPIGMQGRAADMTPVEENELRTLPPDALVYDVIYNPKKTVLIKLAQKCGYRTLNGVDMFIHQALAAEQIWTGRTPDFKDMKIAALENL